jgi:hypothetical protein
MLDLSLKVANPRVQVLAILSPLLLFFFCFSGSMNVGENQRIMVSFNNETDGVTRGDALPHGSASSHNLNVVGRSPSLQHLRW